MKRTVSFVLLGVLTGCTAVPATGPIASDILSQAGTSAKERSERNGAVFDVVDVSESTTQLISRFSSGMLRQRFGIGGSIGKVVIGVGDVLQVDIFEAGSEGLFSTKDSKRTTLDVVIQPGGTASIPYVGTVRFAGKTLEEAQATILATLKSKAIEPDVVVSPKSTASRYVSINGAVGVSANVPLALSAERITEVIARTGGLTKAPYETYVTLIRNGKTGTVLMKTLIDNPADNIFVQPKDQLFITFDPRTFTALGAFKANTRVPFGTNDINLLEAVAMAGGGSEVQTDAAGYFVFRYEEPEIVSDVLGPQRFRDLQAKGLKPNREGRFPIVYRFNMRNPDSLLIGQNFQINNRDVIYASRHPNVDIQNFLNVIALPADVALRSVSLAQ